MILMNLNFDICTLMLYLKYSLYYLDGLVKNQKSDLFTTVLSNYSISSGLLILV